MRFWICFAIAMIDGYLLARHLSWESLFLIAAVPALLAGLVLLTLSGAGTQYR